MPVHPVFTNIMSTITNRINRTLLMAAFEPTKQQLTLDECIREAIIRKRVLIDINTYAGKYARIPILVDYLVPTAQPAIIDIAFNRSSEIYRIPPEVRENRDITTVIGLNYSGDYAAAYPISPAGLFDDIGNSIGHLATQSLYSRTLLDANVTPKAVLLGGNMLRISPPIYSDGLILDCLTAFDEEFTNLPQSAVQSLCMLCLYATQAYIYNQLIVNIDNAALAGGQVLGVVKPMVEKYEDSNDKYDAELADLRGSLMWDPDISRYIIGMCMSS